MMDHEALEKASLGTLKLYLTQMGVPTTGCTEKSDVIRWAARICAFCPLLGL